MLVTFRETIAPQIFRIVDLNGPIADLEPVSLGTTATQSPLRDLRRYRVKTTDEVFYLEQPAQVLRLLNPREDDLYVYQIAVGNRETKVREIELQVAPGSAAPDPLAQLENLDASPANFVTTRAEFLRAYFAATARSLGIVGYNGARMLPIPHQISAVRRALLFGRPRFLLADEVGLGKTVEAGLIVSTLRKYFPQWRAAVFVPDSLTVQWAFEMYGKFSKAIFEVEGLDIEGGSGEPTSAEEEELEAELSSGTIMPHRSAVRWAREGRWPEILVVDEAHQLLNDPAQMDAFRILSREAHAVLLLTATPASGAGHLPALLRLADPAHFDELGDDDEIAELLEHHGAVEKLLLALRDPETSAKEIQALAKGLPVRDPEVDAAMTDAGNLRGAHRARVAALITDRLLPGAKILRYQRKFLEFHSQLPQRVEEPIEYEPTAEEGVVTRAAAEWLEAVREHEFHGEADFQVASAALVQACNSSAGAVGQWLEARRGEVPPRNRVTADPVFRNSELISRLAPLPNEKALLDRLEKANEAWAKATRALDVKARPLARAPRFLALEKQLQSLFRAHTNAHILLFTSFESNVRPLYLLLKKALGPKIEVFAISGEMPWRDREKTAFQFQDKNGACLLISDDLGGEGRNFQFADALVHFDLPLATWMLEQRIGRLDRVGRDPELDVDSQIIVASDGLDPALYEFQREGMGVFNDSIAPVEFLASRVYRRMMEALLEKGEEGVRDLIEPVAEELAERRAQEEASAEERREAESLAALATQLDDRGELLALKDAAVRFTRLLGSIVDEERNRVIVTVGTHHPLHAFPGVLSEMKGYFDRKRAVRHERNEFFSPGHPFLRALARSATEESADRLALILRQGLPHGALVVTYRVSLPMDYIAVVREMEEDIQPTLLCAAANLLPTQMIRVGVDFAGKLIPETEKTEAFFQPAVRGDISLDEGKGIFNALPETWDAIWPVAIEAAQDRVDVQAERSREVAVESLRPLFMEVLCRHLGFDGPVEQQTEALLATLEQLNVELDSVVVLFPG